MNRVKTFLIILLLSISIQALDMSKTYKFGYLNNSMSNYSPKDLKLAMDIWMKEVTKNIGRTEMIFYADPKLAARDIESGKIDYMSAFPIEFVKHFNLEKLSDGFTGGLKDRDGNKFVLLIQKNKNIQSVDALENVKVGIQENDEVMRMYSKVHIKNPRIKTYKSRNRVVLDLFFSKIDVGIVPIRTFKLAEELNPQIKQKIKILQKSEFLSRPLGFYGKTITKKEQQEIYDAGAEAFKTARGKEMMDIYKIETLVPCYLYEVDRVKKLFEAYKNLIKDKK